MSCERNVVVYWHFSAQLFVSIFYSFEPGIADTMAENVTIYEKIDKLFFS